jgi:hypothetical protein
VTRDREHPRYAHEAEITFRVGTASHEGRTRNVSRGGVCAELADAIPVGVDLEIVLVLVFDNGESEPLRLPARIVWCTTVDEAYQVGLVFRPLGPELTRQLTLFLRYLDDNRSEPLAAQATLDDRFR